VGGALREGSRDLVRIREREMAARNGEESPLLGGQRSLGSSETLNDSRDVEEEAFVDYGKANQHVGPGRGLLIAISLGSLIFLQGMLIYTKS
jgi:hypothetical protein